MVTLGMAGDCPPVKRAMEREAAEGAPERGAVGLPSSGLLSRSLTTGADTPYERPMSDFPSLEWCQALVRSLEQDPDVAGACREWGGRSVGVVIGKDGGAGGAKGLARDFCVFARPHASDPRIEELRLCEDEDDLELEEPDYLFRFPHSLALQLLERRLDPVDALMKGQVRVEGDLKRLLSFGQKYRLLGERAIARLAPV